VFDDPNMGSGAMMRVAAQNRDIVYQERAQAHNAERRAQAAEAELQRLRAENERLNLALAVEKSHARGLKAQVSIIKRETPTSQPSRILGSATRMAM
jgi:hypothetical protein